jgi:hypothetical protein
VRAYAGSCYRVWCEAKTPPKSKRKGNAGRSAEGLVITDPAVALEFVQHELTRVKGVNCVPIPCTPEDLAILLERLLGQR